ncbi:MAG: replication protein [Planctomycetes bacterium]|nr:replication protein [Planctomycetota bacterium]
MPVVKVYHHGMTAAMPPKKNNHERAKRGVVQGWSKSATRNNTRWLRSVSPKSFGGEDEFGVAFTLTIRDCPDTSDDWHSMRTSFIKRLRRMGMLRLHWVTEWQRRGVPHLHGIVFFPVDSLNKTDEAGIPVSWGNAITFSWISVAHKYGASPRGQHLKVVTDTKGWFKYLSKHASRGADHYQRSSSGIPSGWVKTGRVWGHCGDWVTDEPHNLNVSNEFYFALRRIVRKWRLSDARTALKESTSTIIRNDRLMVNPAWLSAKKRISSARKILKSNDFKKSQVRGVSEWIDAENILLIAEMLIGQGYEIYLSEEEEARL